MTLSNRNDVDSLFKEAEKLRKTVHKKWHDAMSGTLLVPGVDQDHLKRNLRLALEMSFRIEDYTAQGRPLEWNMEEIKVYKDLIKAVGRLVPAD